MVEEEEIDANIYYDKDFVPCDKKDAVWMDVYEYDPEAKGFNIITKRVKG